MLLGTSLGLLVGTEALIEMPDARDLFLQVLQQKAPLLQLCYLLSRVTPLQALNLQQVRSPKTGHAWVFTV